jgi:hypothetical protein
LATRLPLEQEFGVRVPVPELDLGPFAGLVHENDPGRNVVVRVAPERVDRFVAQLH